MSVKKCSSLQEVREQIDTLDEEIVKLMAQRNAYIKQAASFKVSVDEIKSDKRIDDVIERIRAQALELGLNPNMMTQIYTLMIHEMVEAEVAEFRNAKDL